MKPAFVACHSLNKNGFRYGSEGLKEGAAFIHQF